MIRGARKQGSDRTERSHLKILRLGLELALRFALRLDVPLQPHGQWAPGIQRGNDIDVESLLVHEVSAQNSNALHASPGQGRSLACDYNVPCVHRACLHTEARRVFSFRTSRSLTEDERNEYRARADSITNTWAHLHRATTSSDNTGVVATAQEAKCQFCKDYKVCGTRMRSHGVPTGVQ